VSRYQAIVFDFDGVILDSVKIKSRVFERLFESFGSDVVAKVRQHHLDNGGISRFEKFHYIYNEILGETLGVDASKELGDKFSEYAFEEVCQANYIAGAYDFLEKHHKQTPLYVASGTPESELVQITRHRQLDGFFTGIYGSPRRKGELINGIIKQLKIKPADVVMIGDASTDYEAAMETGTDFIGVGEDSKQFPDASIVIPDLTKLADFIHLS